MRKTVKMLSIILVITMVFALSIGTTSMATDLIDKITSSGSTPAGVESLGADIVNIITTVAIIVAVIVLLILGIKYMMGSASEKAEYKKTMIPYLVGAVLVFGAAAITKFVMSISDTLTTDL